MPIETPGLDKNKRLWATCSKRTGLAVRCPDGVIIKVKVEHTVRMSIEAPKEYIIERIV